MLWDKVMIGEIELVAFVGVVGRLEIKIASFILLSFQLVVPLSLFYKDEIRRRLGKTLNKFCFFSRLALILSIQTHKS